MKDFWFEQHPETRKFYSLYSTYIKDLARKIENLIYTYYKHVHMDNTMMRVSKETRDMLKEIGKKGETYDDIIRRLIEKCK